MSASADNSAKNESVARSKVFEWAPSPWQELKRLQYGADRSLAHVIENEVLTAAPSDFRALENRLLAVLNDAAATLAARDFVCRMLALVGSGSSVPVLTPMLKNAETEHFARLALERIGSSGSTSL
jgi:hypothetical protein